MSVNYQEEIQAYMTCILFYVFLSDIVDFFFMCVLVSLSVATDSEYE